MSIVTISPSNQNISIIPNGIDGVVTVSSSISSSNFSLNTTETNTNTTVNNNIDQNNITINPSSDNNINLNNEIVIAPISIPLLSFINSGRLSLVSNNPISQSNLTGSTIYFTPYLGNEISLYDLTSQKWKIYTFNEVSLILSPMIANTNYDIFCYYNGNTIVLEKTAWSSNSSRATSLSYTDGVLVKSTEFNKKYLGTIRSINTTSTEDSNTRRFVFNYYNVIPKLLIASDNITHTYSSSTIRSYRNINTLGSTRVEFVNGIENLLINIICQSRFVLESTVSSVGISLDSNTTFNTNAINTSIFPFGGPAITLDNNCSDNLKPTIGYHYLQLVQSGSSVSTFYSALLKALFLC